MRQTLSAIALISLVVAEIAALCAVSEADSSSVPTSANDSVGSRSSSFANVTFPAVEDTGTAGLAATSAGDLLKPACDALPKLCSEPPPSSPPSSK